MVVDSEFFRNVSDLLGFFRRTICGVVGLCGFVGGNTLLMPEVGGGMARLFQADRKVEVTPLA